MVTLELYGHSRTVEIRGKSSYETITESIGLAASTGGSDLRAKGSVGASLCGCPSGRYGSRNSRGAFDTEPVGMEAGKVRESDCARREEPEIGSFFVALVGCGVFHPDLPRSMLALPFAAAGAVFF
jgi:hypothetical protein